jgi:hypothetical protein
VRVFFFISNLEKGYTARVDPSTQAAHQTLVRQMNWLDRNMETLLQQAPAPTVRFITHNHRANDNAAVNTAQQQPVKHYIGATAEPIANVSIPTEASSSKSIVNHYAYNPANKKSTTTAASSSSTSKPLLPAVETKPKPPVTEAPPKKKEPEQHQFTIAETRAAEKRRKQEFRRIQTRFCDSFKTVR